ncbi:MAG: carboxypeptidase regulatory-like domain-containing protein [Gemmatimonadaceae bacterium]
MVSIRMLRAACAGLLVGGALLAGTASSARAQASVTQAGKPHSTLVGMIRDSAGRAIPGVEVWLRGSDLYTITNDGGGFRIPTTPVGAVKLTVRRLGYEQATVDLTLREGQTDSLVVALTSVAANLPGVVVEDEAISRSKRLLAGFWERRARGFGHYYTREEIEKRDAHEFVEIVRMTPSLSIVSQNGRKVIRFSRTMGTRGDCPPQYWVDGMRLENASPDEFPPQDIEAIEIYAGAATMPAQFAPKVQSFKTQTCGAIVIWTRLPGT